jgi:hypothetical protein
MKTKLKVFFRSLISVSALVISVSFFPRLAMAEGDVEVLYGASGWIETQKLFRLSFVCEPRSGRGNDSFGSDPIHGVVKACYVDGRKIADQGQEYTELVPRTVRYGAEGWVKRRFPSGSRVLCSNTVFGSDPIVGAAKICKVGTRQVARHGEYFTLN